MFYSGSSIDSAAVAAALTPIQNTQQTTPTSDLTPKQIYHFDTGNSFQASGGYVVQVVQFDTAWGPETLTAAQFSINPTFQINATVGVTR